MGLQIEDGSGSGRLLEILNGRAKVNSKTADRIYYSSRDDEEAYAFSNATYDYAAADTILLVRNDNTEKILHICNIWIQGDTATEVVIHSPTAVFTPAGTAITGTNLNRLSGHSAQVTTIQNETGNAQGVVLWRGFITAASEPYNIDFLDAVILGYHQSIGVDFVTNGAAARVTIWAHFESE